MTRQRARSSLLVNLLVWPGAGSIMAGRRSGYGEAILAAAGALQLASAVIQICLRFVESIQGVAVVPGYGGLVGGVCLFLAGWIWSAWTGWTLLKNAEPPPPPLLK